MGLPYTNELLVLKNCVEAGCLEHSGTYVVHDKLALRQSNILLTGDLHNLVTQSLYSLFLVMNCFFCFSCF